MQEAEIRELEASLTRAEVRASAEALHRLISDEFVEFGSSGRVYTKQDAIAQLLSAGISSFDVTDFRVLAIGPDAALVTYRTERSLRCSVWRREGDSWRIVFHQGTPCMPGS
jgi:hypothetical protein